MPPNSRKAHATRMSVLLGRCGELMAKLKVGKRSCQPRARASCSEHPRCAITNCSGYLWHNPSTSSTKLVSIGEFPPRRMARSPLFLFSCTTRPCLRISLTKSVTMCCSHRWQLALSMASHGEDAQTEEMFRGFDRCDCISLPKR